MNTKTYVHSKRPKAPTGQSRRRFKCSLNLHGFRQTQTRLKPLSKEYAQGTRSKEQERLLEALIEE